MSSRAPVKPSVKRIRRQRAPKSRQLKYCHSVTRNRGFVKFPAAACGGKRVTEWLPGKYQSPESLAAFEKSLGFFLLHGTAPPWVGQPQQRPSSPAGPRTDLAEVLADGPTVEEICHQFTRHRMPGYCYSEQCHYRTAMRDLCFLYAARPADSIGKRELLEVRALFVRAGKCLKGCNGQTRRVKAVFQWAADHELVPDAVPLNLQALRNLKHGEAPTPPRKQAVSDELVRQTCQHLPREAVDIINVLRHSGARSGELYQLRVKDLQMAAKDLWIYQPAKHKNAYRGHSRTILFGPQSLAILKRLVKGRRPEHHVFVRPTWDDPRNRNRHTVGTPWSRYALGSLIARTCKRFELPHWHPHQLRHAAASAAYNRDGGTAAAAQVLRGHATISTTERYITLDEGPAHEQARKFG